MSGLRPHLGKLPATGLFSSYRAKPESEWNVFLAARACLFANCRDRKAIWHVARSWLLLPVYLFTEILVPWARYSGAANRAFGHSRWRQLGEVIRLSFSSGACGRKGYYLAGLAQYRGGSELDRYVHDQLHESLVVFCRYAVNRIHGPQPPLGDKHQLQELCGKHGLRCASSYALALVEGDVQWQSPALEQQARTANSIFVKPARGSQGRNTERWDKTGKAYVDSTGNRQESFEALLLHISNLARQTRTPILIQENLENSDFLASLGSRALCTIRLTTLRDHDGQVTPVQAAFRVAGQENAAVDNYHAGGVLFHVDEATGEVGFGLTMDFPSDLQFIHRSPLSGVELSGKVLPGWEEVCALCVRAHERLTFDTICGWDVGITSKGPVIVECNMVPGNDVPGQRPTDGFLGTLYARLFRSEILNSLDQIEPEGSRFRFQAERDQMDRS